MARRSRPRWAPPEINIRVAHTSRVYDYLLGGTDNFSVDREVAEHAFGAYPGGVDGARADARANRAFLGRAVRHMADEAGIRQFLDVGTGIPNANNVHAVAQAVAPETRVVYVDNDPIVLAHAHFLLSNTPEGETAYREADARDPEVVLEQASETLDLTQPVAVVLIGLLHVIGDDDDPHAIVSTLMDAVGRGSHLALSHMVADRGNMHETSSRLDAAMRTSNPPALRPLADVELFFSGLEVLEPGLVPVDRWRPDGTAPATERTAPVLGGVARKP